MNIANALERALHLEAVIRIEEEKQTPRIADIRGDETVILENSANRLVQQTSIGNEKNARSKDGRRYNAHCGETRIDGNWYSEQSSRDRARTQEQNCAKELTIPGGRETMTNVGYVGKRQFGEEFT